MAISEARLVQHDIGNNEVVREANRVVTNNSGFALGLNSGGDYVRVGH